MVFNFRNRTIIWGIPKWNREQINCDGEYVVIGFYLDSQLTLLFYILLTTYNLDFIMKVLRQFFVKQYK